MRATRRLLTIMVNVLVSVSTCLWMVLLITRALGRRRLFRRTLVGNRKVPRRPTASEYTGGKNLKEGENEAPHSGFRRLLQEPSAERYIKSSPRQKS